MNDVKALLFDTFGTVVDWRGSLIAELAAWSDANGCLNDYRGDWVGLVDAWRAAYRPALDRVRRGDVAWTRLDDLHRQALDQLLPRFGLAGLSEADRAWVNRGWHRLRPWPDAVPGLLRLKRRFVVAPLSNGNLSLLLAMARNAGLPWDTVFGADLFGHYKPDAETYLGACRLLDLPPGQVMMCAAHNDDLAAASGHGLRTAFIARPAEYGPHQERDFAATGPWDHAVAGIGELADRLGC